MFTSNNQTPEKYQPLLRSVWYYRKNLTLENRDILLAYKTFSLSLPLPFLLPVKSKARISHWKAVRFVEKLRRPPGTRNYTQRMSRAISSTWLSLWLCLAPPLSLLSPPILYCYCFSMALKLNMVEWTNHSATLLWSLHFHIFIENS